MKRAARTSLEVADRRYLPVISTKEPQANDDGVTGAGCCCKPAGEIDVHARTAVIVDCQTPGRCRLADQTHPPGGWGCTSGTAEKLGFCNGSDCGRNSASILRGIVVHQNGFRGETSADMRQRTGEHLRPVP